MSTSRTTAVATIQNVGDLAQDATEASDALNASEESPSVLHAGGKRNSALGAAARTM